MTDRILGGMLGLAIGDAMGASVEFLERSSFPEVTQFRSGGVFNLPAGTYTDDTAMTLCLAQSLIDKGFNPYHQMDMYCKWVHHGLYACDNNAIGLGETVRSALLEYIENKNPYAGQTKMDNASNGALVRLFPVVVFGSTSLENVVKFSKLSTLTTHGLDICVEASVYFSSILYGSLIGKSKQEILSSSYESSLLNNQLKDEKIVDIYRGSYKTMNINDISSTGYVVDSLISALWAFETSNSFEEGLFKAVNLGGDADTIGAIYGQLAGSYYGYKKIDKQLVGGLRRNKVIFEMAKNLAQCKVG